MAPAVVCVGAGEGAARIKGEQQDETTSILD
jgi:hypothetical protein